MNWELIVRIFDIVGCAGIVLSLNLVLRFHRMWLLYAFSTTLFIIAQTYAWRIDGANTVGAIAMGVALLFTGLRNYRKECRKNK